MTEEAIPVLQSRNEVVAGSESRQLTLKSEIKLDVPGLKGIEPINDRSAAVVNYRSYCHLNKSSRNDEDVAHELHRIVKRIGLQMKHYTFSGKEFMSVITFLQDLKSASSA